jgi:hypothetical protein
MRKIDPIPNNISCSTHAQSVAGMALKARAPYPEEKYVSVLTTSQLEGKDGLNIFPIFKKKKMP